MRITHAILAGTIAAALASLTTPMLAKAPQAQKAEDKSSPPACYSYEQAADGEWKSIPCAEGSEGGARTQHKPAAGSADEATH